MKVSYLVLVHQKPFQLERLVCALMHPDVDFYIHVDKKADIKPFQQVLSGDRIHFISERVRVVF